MCTCRFYSHSEASVNGHEIFKIWWHYLQTYIYNALRWVSFNNTVPFVDFNTENNFILTYNAQIYNDNTNKRTQIQCNLFVYTMALCKWTNFTIPVCICWYHHCIYSNNACIIDHTKLIIAQQQKLYIPTKIRSINYTEPMTSLGFTQ